MFGNSKMDPSMVGNTPIAGPTLGVVDSFGLGYETQRVAGSAAGAQFEMRSRLEEQRTRFEEAGVLDDPANVFPHPNDLGAFSLINEAVEAGVPLDELDTSAFTMSEVGEARFFLDNWDATIAPLVPGTPTLSEMFADVQTSAQELEARSAMSDMSVVGSFGGAMAGSFTGADPLNQITVGVGGFGKTIWQRLATEGLTQAGIEGTNQLTAVPENREILGLDPFTPGEVAFNIAAAGVGGAALRGVAEGAPPAFRAAERRLAPQRVAARAVMESVDTGNLVNTGSLRAFAEFMPDSTVGRAARAQANAVAREMELSVYRDQRQFEAAVTRVLQEAEQDRRLRDAGGTPPERSLFEPIDVPDMAPTRTPPTPERLVNAARQVIFAEREATLTARMNELDDQLAELESAAARVEEAPLSQLVDDERVNLLEEKADRPPPSNTMERELDALFPEIRRSDAVDAFNELRRIEAEEFADVRFKAKIEAQLRVDRMRVEMAKVRRDLFEARRQAREARQAGRDLATAEAPRDGSPAAARDEVPAPTPVPRPAPPSGRMTMLEAARARATVDAEKLNAAVETKNAMLKDARPRMMERFRETLKNEDGMVDLGNGRMVPRDFVVRVSDEFGNNMEKKTLDELADDLASDEKFTEAVTGCSING
jgi:hypothetical protein